MDENNTVFEEEFYEDAPVDPSEVDEAWDNIKWGADDEDDTPEASEQSEGDTETADQPESEEPAQETETEDSMDETAEDADQWLELKHLDETRKVNREEAKVLAQKGLDYDRIREERDSLKSNLPRYLEMEKFLQEMQGDFDSIEEFMDDTRARVRADAEGISYNEALAQVQASKKAAPAEQKSDPNGIGVDAFVKKYPNVKAEDIPASVWAEVQTTGDLVSAYDNYEASRKSDRIAQLEQEIETLKNNKKNQARSTGSSKSSGVSGTKSLIASLWESDD